MSALHGLKRNSLLFLSKLCSFSGMVALAYPRYYLSYVAYFADDVIRFGAATVEISSMTSETLDALSQDLASQIEAEQLIILSLIKVES